MYYKNKYLSLHKKSVFYDITIRKQWTAPSHLPLTISLLTASRMVYWTRCLLNNGHQSSALLRVCYQKENTQLVRVCCREKTLQIRPNNSLLDMTPRNDRSK